MLAAPPPAGPCADDDPAGQKIQAQARQLLSVGTQLQAARDHSMELQRSRIPTPGRAAPSARAPHGGVPKSGSHKELEAAHEALKRKHALLEERLRQCELALE